MVEGAHVHPRSLIALLAVLGCGGRLAPLDGGSPADGSADEGTSSADASDSSAPDGMERDTSVPCDYDASDDALCVPPSADQLVADPPTITVPGGGFGTATFVATGPWTSDPTLELYYLSSSLPLINQPLVLTYGSPQTIPIGVSRTAVGQMGTVTVAARAGNIERRADVVINVTRCAPWPSSMVCGGEDCGFEGDGCGGVLSCGSCPAPAPYCFLHKCVATMPTYCPSGEGYGPGGTCIPCAGTRTCTECPAGVLCVGLQDVCICEQNYGGVPPPPRL
jgi:hypothetical protein